MTRCLRACAILASLGLGLALLVPAARAAQDPQTWEFNLFGARGSFGGGLQKFTRTEHLDLDGDGTDDTGGSFDTRHFDRALDIKDDSFAGFRIGYVWSRLIETEISYDKNHAHAEYEHRFTEIDSDLDDTSFVPTDERVKEGLSVNIAAYQIGLQYTPLGNWRSRWQPYAAFGVGYIEANFNPSRSAKSAISSSAAALCEQAGDPCERTEFTHDNASWLFTYGVGVKYYIDDAFAIRAEVRGRSSDLFNERQNDREVNFGISVFVPSISY